MFLVNKDNDFILIGSSTNSTLERLEKGVYNTQLPTMTNPSFVFSKNEDYKKGMIVDSGVFKESREFLNDFFSESLTDARNALGMRHKLGVMFNGEPGTGKTFLAGQIAQELCDKHDAIGILATRCGDYSDMIDGIRSDDPNRKIILIIDEFEKTFKSYDTDFLSFLSGAKERDNTIIIATVNDTSQLPAFIQDRPSRFERTFNFTFKDDIVLESVVRTLIPDSYKNKINTESLLARIKEHKNMSIDRMRHVIRDVIAADIHKERTGEDREIRIAENNEIKRTVGFIAPADEVLELSDLLSSEELSVDGMVDWRETQLN